jgi:hypothetical protein
MINNFTNINKAKNHLSPQLVEHMTLKNQVLAWNKHKNMAELNQLMGSQY